MVTLLDFYADWCGPCKVMAPVIEGIAKDYVGKVTVEEIDVDQNQERASSFGIQSIPTLVFLKDGKEVDRTIGAQPRDSIVRLLSKYLS